MQTSKRTMSAHARLIPILVVGVSVVSQLMRSSSHVVGVVVASSVLAIAAYPFLKQQATSAPPAAAESASALILGREHEEVLVPAIDSPTFPVSAYPKKGYKYLAQNPPLIALVHSLRFVRMFDRPRFQEVILTLDHYQRTYIYILGQRLTPSAGVPLLQDLRSRVLTLMYSLYFVVPPRLKHVYGLNPHARLGESIAAFTAISLKMSKVVRDFVRLDLNLPWTHGDGVEPANQNDDAAALP